METFEKSSKETSPGIHLSDGVGILQIWETHDGFNRVQTVRWHRVPPKIHQKVPLLHKKLLHFFIIASGRRWHVKNKVKKLFSLFFLEVTLLWDTKKWALKIKRRHFLEIRMLWITLQSPLNWRPFFRHHFVFIHQKWPPLLQRAFRVCCALEH